MALRAGAPFAVACAFARLNPEDVAAYLRRGEDARNEAAYRFRSEVTRAVAELEVSALQVWTQSGDWRAAKELLTQFFPERYSPVQAAAAELATLQRRKLLAEIELLEQRTAALRPGAATVDVLDVASVDELFRAHFGHPGNRPVRTLTIAGAPEEPGDGSKTGTGGT